MKEEDQLEQSVDKLWLFSVGLGQGSGNESSKLINKQVIVDLRINNITLNMQLDSGSAVSRCPAELLMFNLKQLI